MGIGIFYISAFLVYCVVDYYAGKRRQHLSLSNICPPPSIAATDIVVLGKDLAINNEEADRILSKRFHYYQGLDGKAKAIFLKRLQRFMQQKTFIIKDDEGFREMPVLVSAAAVQLTFGLDSYLLPFYKYIRIHPQEFVSDDFLKVLAGNVYGNIITVAWNHLLHGYKDSYDGSNVGLHEMSHALYIQKMEVEKNYAKSFAKKYNRLLKTCEGAMKVANEGSLLLYSAYATKNLQEFWAESIELFFEKPAELKKHYPQIFSQLSDLLNQNPVNRENPLLFQRKLAGIIRP